MVKKHPTKQERHRLTLEALADVDARRVIDHQAVQTWGDRLDRCGFDLDPNAHADFNATLDNPATPSNQVRARMRRKPSWDR